MQDIPRKPKPENEKEKLLQDLLNLEISHK